MKNAFLAGLVLLSVVATGSAWAGGDIAKGKKVFLRCQACHSVAGKNGVGPELNGVFGRTAGTVAGFDYSKAMKEAGAAGLVWTDATLAEFLKKPRKFMKGTKMSFVGLRKEADAANVIAYLRSIK